METEGGVVSGTTVTVAVPVTPPTSAVIVATVPGLPAVTTPEPEIKPEPSTAQPSEVVSKRSICASSSALLTTTYALSSGK